MHFVIACDTRKRAHHRFDLILFYVVETYLVVMQSLMLQPAYINDCLPKGTHTSTADVYLLPGGRLLLTPRPCDAGSTSAALSGARCRVIHSQNSVEGL